MGGYLSQPAPLPDLPADVIQSIIAQTPTSAILDSAIYVNRKWNEIGRRNVIWIPRYKELTGITLNPADYHEYEVFPEFMNQWNHRVIVVLDDITKEVDYVRYPYPMEWIDTHDPGYKSDILGVDVEIREDNNIYPIPGNYVLDKPPITLLMTTWSKDPKLVRLYRQAGLPLQTMDISEEMTIVTKENALLGDEILGQGSFNCAILTSDGDVLRIASLTLADAWTRRAIPRGAAIVHLFNEYKDMLGPSVVQETREGWFSKSLPYTLVTHVCETIRRSPGPFYMQRIEHLDGGFDPNIRFDSPEAHAFPLVWFLHAAQGHFGFRHGDFKRGNIVFRTYDPPQRFTFRLNDRYTYSYEFYKVPVVIDFDFATIYSGTTPPGDRLVLGTPQSVPPEALLVRLKLVMGATNVIESEYDDWWSLGMVLFEYWNPRVQIGRRYNEQFKEYAAVVWSSFGEDPAGVTSAVKEREWLGHCMRRLFDAYLIIRGLYHRGEMPEPPKYMYSEKALQILNNIRPYGVMLNHFQVNILRQLLSWDPRERGKDLLTRHFRETLGYFPDFTYPALISDRTHKDNL